MKKMQRNQDPEEILDNRIERVQRKRETSRSVLELLIFIAVGYVVFFYIIGVVRVQGVSMTPNLRDGELLLFYRLDKQYKEGDIVLIHMGDHTEFVKRIVAVEGDTVDLEEETGTLLVNGEPLEEPYIYSKTYPTTDKVTFPLKVGAGEVFVLGDNREVSRDSREFGCVRVSEITGRVLLHGGSINE